MLSLYKSSKKCLVFRFGVDVCMLQGKVNNYTAAKKYSPGVQGKGRRLQGQKTGDTRYLMHTAIAVLSINHGQLFHF